MTTQATYLMTRISPAHREIEVFPPLRVHDVEVRIGMNWVTGFEVEVPSGVIDADELRSAHARIVEFSKTTPLRIQFDSKWYPVKVTS